MKNIEASSGLLMKRGSGVLIHITSLPSPYGIGDMGPGAYGFADFLCEAKQDFWQILPLTLTSGIFGNSPYSSFSAFAGNLYLISPESLVKDGILEKSDIQEHPVFSNRRVQYRKVTKYKIKLLDKAYQRNKSTLTGDRDFQRFCRENTFWLNDYALFIALKGHFKGSVWNTWPDGLRNRKERELQKWNERLQEVIVKEKYLQYLFFLQWGSLKEHCERNDIRIIGDMPIYVNYDSADVWANTAIFNLNREKKPAFVAGVPPDYFSSTGQLWGHPVYNWDVLKRTNFAWWIKRIEYKLRLFHIFRLDHFRGFVAYWMVSASRKTAIQGTWEDAPARDFFNTLLRHFPHLPIIAEDLGYITTDVREIIHLYGFPCMKVLVFAFDKKLPSNIYAPHNHIKNCVVYTGTHDNNTIKGWFRKELGKEGKKRLSAYIGHTVSEKNIHWELIRLAMMSVADTVIIPMQDILGLGEDARMNRPASSRGNWEWRVRTEQLSPSLIKKLSETSTIYGRGL
jgi:4-alpha-glucanotransferase